MIAIKALTGGILPTKSAELTAFRKALAGIKRRTKLVLWKQSHDFARELTELLHFLVALKPSPRAGIEGVAEFFKADDAILNMCDDSSGYVGDVFRFDAADLFANYAQQCEDKDWLLDLIIDLNKCDNFGVRDSVLERMSSFLPETSLSKAADRFWELAQSETKEHQKHHWLSAIALMAQQLKDPDLLEKCLRARGSGKLPIAFIIDIGELHLAKGDAAQALHWIAQVPLTETFQANQRDELLLKIYEQLGNFKKRSETAWRIFRKNKCLDTLEQLLSVIGETNRTAILNEEETRILNARVFSITDARFLTDNSRIDAAERYLIEHVLQIDGIYYSELLEIAKVMSDAGRNLATSSIYRALLESILDRAKSKYYPYGVKYLKKLDSLAMQISDWKQVEPHIQYLANLRQQHKLKSSFWSRYDEFPMSKKR